LLEWREKMSRKHFIELAKVVASLKGQMTEENRKVLAEKMANFCAEQNSMFRPARFMSACGF
jgi:hypothetical protein